MAEQHDEQASSSSLGDIKGLLRQLVAPVIEQLDAKVSSHLDEQVDDHIEIALSSRLATLDRAIGDLDRHLKELEARVAALEAPPVLDDED